MPRANLATAFAFATAAILLLSCGDSEPPATAKTQRAASGWYVEQIEEGFGHLDRLPRNWSAVPSPHHTAWFAGGGSE